MEKDHIILCEVHGDLLQLTISSNGLSYEDNGGIHYLDKEEAKLLIDVLTKFVDLP